MRRQESDIKLTKEQKSKASVKIKEYMDEYFEIEIGNLQAEIFIEYITENIGKYYYNKGIADSMLYMTEKAEDLYLLMKDEN